MMHVFEITAVGDHGRDFPDFIATTIEVAKAVAEREYGPLDYFGKPIDWNEPNADNTHLTGLFHAEPYNPHTIIIARRDVHEL